MKIRFIGAAREVTGSKHLITTKQGKKNIARLRNVSGERHGNRCDEP